ncbi:MAG: hypothetical protein ACTHMM_05500 [Agriterribacter sp.]
MYTDEQIQEWKTKAEKWDALRNEIAACYVKPDESNPDEFVENDDPNVDLGTIGEIAASAFGWL